MIDIKDTLVLSDNNEYVVVSKAVMDNVTYYYLVDINNITNFKFFYLDKDELVEIEDKELIRKLIPLLTQNIKFN